MSNDDKLTSPNPRKRTRQSINSPTSKSPATMLAQDANANNAQATPEGAAAAVGDSFITDNDAGESGGDDDEEEGTKPSDKKAGRRKIKIEFIQDKSRRHITFSKRKAGIMKKAYELSTLTGTQVLLLVVSETGLVYTFTTAKLQPLVTQPEGKNLIQACLNAPHGSLPSSLPVGAPLGRSAPQSIPPPPPPNPQQQPMPGQAPPHMQGGQGAPRNVPGGLTIGGAKDDDEHAGDRHDDVDNEGDKRGAARRRTSASGASAQGAKSGASGRSPTSPHAPHLNIPAGAPGGQPSPQGGMLGGAPGGGQPYSPSSTTDPNAPGGAQGAQMYHPMHHQPGMMAQPYPYQPNMGNWAPGPTPAGNQTAYPRR